MISRSESNRRQMKKSTKLQKLDDFEIPDIHDLTVNSQKSSQNSLEFVDDSEKEYSQRNDIKLNNDIYIKDKKKVTKQTEPKKQTKQSSKKTLGVRSRIMKKLHIKKDPYMDYIPNHSFPRTVSSNSTASSEPKKTPVDDDLTTEVPKNDTPVIPKKKSDLKNKHIEIPVIQKPSFISSQSAHPSPPKKPKLSQPLRRTDSHDSLDDFVVNFDDPSSFNFKSKLGQMNGKTESKPNTSSTTLAPKNNSPKSPKKGKEPAKKGKDQLPAEVTCPQCKETVIVTKAKKKLINAWKALGLEDNTSNTITPQPTTTLLLTTEKKKRKSGVFTSTFQNTFRFHKLHLGYDKVIPDGKKKGFPSSINFEDVEERVIDMKNMITDVILKRSPCFYWDLAVERYKVMGKSARDTNTKISHLQEIKLGYYGEKGAKVILRVIQDLFLDHHRESFNNTANAINASLNNAGTSSTAYPQGRITPENTNPLSQSEYIRDVLIPFIITRLIMQDKGCTEELARDIMSDSAEFGDVLFGYDSFGED